MGTTSEIKLKALETLVRTLHIEYHLSGDISVLKEAISSMKSAMEICAKHQSLNGNVKNDIETRMMTLCIERLIVHNREDNLAEGLAQSYQNKNAEDANNIANTYLGAQMTDTISRADALTDQFSLHKHQISYLEEAIELHRRVLEHVPKAHTYRPKGLDRLATSLW